MLLGDWSLHSCLVVYIGGAHGLGRFQIFAAYCSSLGFSILRHLLIVTVPDT